jgi:hypothetical protein
MGRPVVLFGVVKCSEGRVLLFALREHISESFSVWAGGLVGWLVGRRTSTFVVAVLYLTLDVACSRNACYGVTFGNHSQQMSP